jgi:hypothetical protein
VHRIEAPPNQAIDVLEVSHGKDEDVERLEDDYGRTTKTRSKRL